MTSEKKNNTSGSNVTAVNIIGAGLAGLSAAITLAKNGIYSNLVSVLPSERSQSVLAEGGINGALDTMGENDTVQEHFQDTMKAGCYIADPRAVKNLTENAPDILRQLRLEGVPFNLNNGSIAQRNFGGQKKKRTAFARSSTGKMLMMALIDESRKYEAAGLIRRYMRHELACLMLDTDDTLITDSGSALEHSYNEKNSSEARRCCHGALVRDIYSQELVMLKGPVILAFGGMNGLFPSETTGTVTNSADAAALCFIQGIRFSNLEMIQYHPTTISIAGKRCLVSEAARGEGGRLFVMRDGSPWHFMEELHPEMGNLSPRDVVAREMFFVARGTTSLESTKRSCKGNAIVDNAEVDKSDPGNDGAVDQIWLDMRHLSKDVWDEKLPDLRKEIIHYLGIDPSKEPVPVEPGIHYFMGGIDVDTHHRTSAEGLYAAGECCSQYHGANRLGGNSTMGAIYGGYAAAKDICTNFKAIENVINEQACAQDDITFGEMGFAAAPLQPEYDHMAQKLKTILMQSMGIVREEETLLKALAQIRSVLQNVPEAEPYDPQYPGTGTKAEEYSKYNICKKYDQRIIARFLLAQAMLESAVLRKESRGAHFRSDHPETKECFRGMTVCEYINNRNGNLQDGLINTWFRESV